MLPQNISLPAIGPFQLSITHHPHVLPLEINESHCHDLCEIYVNLSGKVAFMVEGRLYPVERGDCMITRPFEYHHCVFQKMEPHEHYWILFSWAENEQLLSAFFDRPAGIGNRIVPANKEHFIKLCETLTETSDPLLQYTTFFSLLQALKDGTTPKETNLPSELQIILREMNENFSAPLRIEGLAEKHYLSISTLERQFKDYLRVTPLEYLLQKRLSHAANLLSTGASVAKAALESGFHDTSHFITLFKRRFGKTPLQYKKALQNNP